MTRTKGTSRIKKTGAHVNNHADLNENTGTNVINPADLNEKTGTGNPANATGTTANTDALISNDQAAQVVEKKRGHSKWMADLSADSGKPGDNARYIRYALASWDLPPIDISDPKQVEQRIGDYFRHCMDNDRKPQIVGMCNWLGVSRDTLNMWMRGETRSKTHTDIIKKAHDLIEEMWMDNMQNGKTNPAAGIFLAKNWFGYKDIADVVVTPNNPLQDMDADQAAKRITDAIPVDDGDVE